MSFYDDDYDDLFEDDDLDDEDLDEEVEFVVALTE